MIMKNPIKISVQTTYLQEQSDTEHQQFAHSYTINITNHSDIGAQLLARHWYIQDEMGHVETVIGEGVVGQQPHISPGESFEYSSGAVIKTPTGTMKGSYSMLGDDGSRFEVEIPEFILSEPYTLH